MIKTIYQPFTFFPQSAFFFFGQFTYNPIEKLRLL